MFDNYCKETGTWHLIIIIILSLVDSLRAKG